MSIYGNSFLTSIAYRAKSPTQAAKWAEHFGCSKEQVRGVHTAAKFKRDKGLESFVEEYSPFDLVDFSIKEFKHINIAVEIGALDCTRPLNATEYNIAIKEIESTLYRLGVKSKIKPAVANPKSKSKLK
jgi:hypothetical protein